MSGSDKAVYAAIAGNAAVAVSKFTVAFFSGSPAMFAEAVHSLADLGNGSLLVYGRKRSQRSPDAEHPFGYGQELYFWSFVVAVLIFAVGASFAFYEGVRHVLYPDKLENPLWSYIVLALSALFEGSSLLVGYREFRLATPGKALWKGLRTSKDPPAFGVVLEDMAALAGIAIAAIGICLAHYFREPRLDGVASVLIGCLLTAVSVLIARETKELLLGEGMSREALHDIQRIIQQCPGVRRAHCPLTMYFGPETVLLAIDVEFAQELDSAGLAATIDRIEASVRRKYPKVSRIYIEAQAIGSAAGFIPSSPHD